MDSPYVIKVPPGNYFIEDILNIYELLDSNFETVVISSGQIEFENLSRGGKKKPIAIG